MKLLVVTVSLVVVLSTCELLFENDTDNYGIAIYNSINQHNAFSKGGSTILKPILKSISNAIDWKKPFAINSPYDNEKLNILIFDSTMFSSQDWLIFSKSKARDKRILEAAKNNAIAVGKDLLIIDVNLVQNIIHRATMGQVYRIDFQEDLQHVNMNEDGPEDFFNNLFEMARRQRIYSSVQDFGSMRRLSIEKGQEGHKIHEMNSIDSDILGIVSTPDYLTSSCMIALSPLLLHEIGHLVDTNNLNTSNNFSEIIDTPIKTIQNLVLSKREIQADDFVGQMLPKVLAQFKKEKKYQTIGAQEILLSSYLGFIRYLRDDWLTDVFSGFRGLNTEDLFVRFSYSECSNDLGYIGGRGADDLNKVYDGVRRFKNVLTADEFANLRKKINDKTLNRIHLSSLLRSDIAVSV